VMHYLLLDRALGHIILDDCLGQSMAIVALVMAF